MSLISRVVKSDGTCGHCSKKADGATMTCFSCDKLWHVIECAPGADDLATKTFLNIWKPWKAAGNYKSICFVCPPCRDANLLQREVVSSNRMSVMEERVSSLQDDLKVIKELLTNGQTNPVAPAPQVTPPTKTYAQASDSVIVIKNKNHAQAVDRNTIKEAVHDSRVNVSGVYDNKQGNTVLVCESEAGKERLAANLRGRVKDRDINTPAQRTPTIRITCMEEEHSTETVLQLAKEQNRDKGINIDAENFKVLFVRKHAKNANLFQAVVRVTNDIRVAIQNVGNKLHVGLTVCPIYDHFHVRRCNKCQGFNHYKDKCESDPICGKCAGAHETEGCASEQPKCTNCVKNKYDDTNHLASDPLCKSYMAAQKKLEQSIGFYKKN